MPYKGDKGDKSAARPPEGSLVETRCLIKGPKSAIVPFPGPRSGPWPTSKDLLTQLCTDTRCSLEDLLEAMDDGFRLQEREREREREREIVMSSVI